MYYFLFFIDSPNPSFIIDSKSSRAKSLFADILDCALVGCVEVFGAE